MIVPKFIAVVMCEKSSELLHYDYKYNLGYFCHSTAELGRLDSFAIRPPILQLLCLDTVKYFHHLR
jgi:hypothetical protein